MPDCRSLLAVRLAAALATVLLAAAPPAWSAAPTGTGVERDAGAQPDETKTRPEIAGFRSARFGMSRAEVMKAISRDFRVGQEDIVTEPNPVEKTTRLIATVEDIIEDGGPARVVYIHGYKSDKLIQVNVLWGATVGQRFAPQTLINTANILRNYFAEQGFAPERTVMNLAVDDKHFIVFRATDDSDRMVLLRLISADVAAGEAGKTQETRRQPAVLWLSYIEDTKNPDIFRIEKGKF